MKLNPYQAHIVKAVVDHLKTNLAGKEIAICELGAGGGEVAGEIANDLRQSGIVFTFDCFDIQPNLIEKRNIGLKCRYLDVQGPFNIKGTYDVVIASELIEHIENPFHFIREMATIGKVGSYLILTTPNLLSLGSRLRYFLTGGYEHFRRPYDEFELKWGHVNPINPLQLIYFLRKNGYNVTKLDAEELEPFWILFLPFLPFIWLASLLQHYVLVKGRAQKKRNRQTLKLLFSWRPLFGRTLIAIAMRNKDFITMSGQHYSPDKRFEP